MSLIPHGAHVTQARPVDLDEYPFRALLIGANPDAPAFVMWLDRLAPLDDDARDSLIALVQRGGHVFIAARASEVRDRARDAVLAATGTYLRDSAS